MKENTKKQIQAAITGAALLVATYGFACTNPFSFVGYHSGCGTYGNSAHCRDVADFSYDTNNCSLGPTQDDTLVVWNVSGSSGCTWSTCSTGTTMIDANTCYVALLCGINQVEEYDNFDATDPYGTAGGHCLYEPYDICPNGQSGNAQPLNHWNNAPPFG